MIQFNLLPDVKLDYIKTRRTKRLVMLVSMAAAGISLAALIIMFLTVQVAQKKHISDLNKDIKSQEKTLSDTPDLNKILTIQNQLSLLPELHNNKPLTSRLFGYIQQVTPVNTFISSLNIDFVENTVTLSGTADSLVRINTFADTLKFATYKSSTTEAGKPFTNVVTTLTGSEGKASYTLNFTIDPVLFAGDETPTLVVPKITSTRSETEKPASIFKEDPKKEGEN